MNSFDLPRRFRIEENIHTKAAVVSRREGVVLRVALRVDICLEGAGDWRKLWDLVIM